MTTWSTSFDYPEWIASDGITDAICTGAVDGITGSAGQSSQGNYTQITSAANNPLGTGRGNRVWIGNGQNNSSGGCFFDLSGTFPGGLTEMWVRIYMKIELGATFVGDHPSYWKCMDWGLGQPNRLIWGHQNGWPGIFAGVPGTGFPATGTDWETVMGGTTGDGQWHCYEYHALQNGANGKSSMWVDDVLVLNNETINHGSDPWVEFQLNDNQHNIANVNDFATDYDDIAVSNTGRIGPLSGGGGSSIRRGSMGLR